MSILKLLTAGKSLVGLKDHHTPYRMCRHGYLPKFESSKNPFTGQGENCARPETTVFKKNNPFAQPGGNLVNLSLFDAELNPVATAAALEETAAPSATAPVAQPVPVAAVPHEPQAVKITVEKSPAPEPEPVRPIARQTMSTQPTLPVAKPLDKTHLAGTRKKSLFQDWMKKFNPLLYFGPGEAEGNRPRGRSQVQAEFSLNNVKPVRNDLHDADLEVVAAKQPSREVIAPHPVAVEVTGSGDGMAGRITTRIFGGAKLQAK